MNLISRTDSRRSHWTRRAILGLAGLVLLRVIWELLSSGFDWLVPSGPVRRSWLSGLLWAIFAGYATTIILSTLGTIGLVVWFFRSNRSSRFRPMASRFLLLAITGLTCVVMAEGMALALRSRANRQPVLPSNFLARTESSLHTVVIGESSAYGYPYAEWFSIGQVVNQGLREAFPGRQVDVNVLAQPGATLASMHERLAWLKQKPDLMIIYAGHNEFIARYSWWRYTPYYSDEVRVHPLLFATHQAGRCSPFLGWILDVIDHQRISGAPSTKWEMPTEPVQIPVCSPAEIRELRDDFERRLESIVSYCERIGCLAVLVIPPSNDADLEPGRTVASPSTPFEERQAIGAEIRRLRDFERSDPAKALEGYRSLLSRQPTLAEAHYRVGRLLESASRLKDADAEYQLARDLDGMPLRCLGSFHEAYRSVAARHDVVLIDGPSVLKELSPKSLLDENAFNDGVHPSMPGHVALAHAVLEGLRKREAFSWLSDHANPSLETLVSQTKGRLDNSAWATVCERTARYYDRTYRIRFDPAERLEKSRRLFEAAELIRAGRSPETFGLDWVGPPQTAVRSQSNESRQK